MAATGQDDDAFRKFVSSIPPLGSDLQGRSATADRDLCGFVLLSDMVQRYDALLLEIRHLQTNIVHNMRESIFLGALRFEEHYLWGYYEPGTKQQYFGESREGQSDRRPWEDLLAKVANPSSEFRDIARRWIIAFPPISPSPPEPQNDSSVAEKWSGQFVEFGTRDIIAQSIGKRLRDVRTQGLWRPETERTYGTLRGLQLLKREALADKLYLFWWAGFALDWGWGPLDRADPAGDDPSVSDPNHAPRLAHFVVARAALFARLREYLHRYGDLLTQFEKSLDLDAPDQHRPFLTRRREQGLYSGFLPDRCDAFRDDINLLIDRLCFFAHEGDVPPASETLDYHRWQFTATSQSTSYRLDVAEHPDGGGGSRSRRTNTARSDAGGSTTGTSGSDPGWLHFVNSSFWMPDRPDLVPILCHEVAHHCMRDRLCNLGTPYLARSSDSMASLLRQLHHCFVVRHDPTSYIPPESLLSFPSPLIREIAADILSTTIMRESYLFAIFQDIIGLEIESFFSNRWRGFDINLVLDYWSNGFGREHHTFAEWHYRLHIITTLLEEISLPDDKLRSSPLAPVLISGVRGLLHCLEEHFISKSQDGEKYRFTWRAIAEDLRKVVQGSAFVDDIRRWDREILERVRPNDETSLVYLGRRIDSDDAIPRFFRRLLPAAQEFLHHALVSRKAFRLDRLMCHILSNSTISDRFYRPSHNYPYNFKIEDRQRMLFCLLYLPGERYKETLLRFMEQRDASPFQQISISCGKKEIDSTFSRLYQHLHQIPWESAILRARDFTAANWENVHRTRVASLNEDMCPGGEFYQFALEVLLWDAKDPLERLSNAIRTVFEFGHDMGWEGDISSSFYHKLAIGDPEKAMRFDEIGNYNQTDNESQTAAEFKNKWNDSIHEWLCSKRLPDAFTRRDRTLIVRDEILALANRFASTSWDDKEWTARLREKVKTWDAATLMDMSDYPPFKRNFGGAEFYMVRQVYKRIIGHKLKELSIILSRLNRPASANWPLSDLHDYLLLHADQRRADLINLLIKHRVVFEGQTDMEVVEKTRTRIATPTCPFDLAKLSRISVISPLPCIEERVRNPTRHIKDRFLDKEKVLPIGQPLGQIGDKPESEPSVFSFYSHKYRLALAKGLGLKGQNDGDLAPFEEYRSDHWWFRIFGRFDIFTMRCAAPLMKWQIHTLFPNGSSGPTGSQDQGSVTNVTRKTFPAFFERRELALPFHLKLSTQRQTAQGDTNFDEPIVIGLVSILLGQRAHRLSFLRRLMPAPEDVIFRHRYNDWFSEYDIAFLAEGWGDVIVVFRAPPRKSGSDYQASLWEHQKTIDNMIGFQTEIYDDFAVDRTETIWGIDALPSILEEDLCNRFTLTAHVRLAEDRYLMDFNGQYYRLIERRWGDLTALGAKLFLKTPGRLDYEVRFDLREMREKVLGGGHDQGNNILISGEDILNQIADLMYDDILDSFSTVISEVKLSTSSN